MRWGKIIILCCVIFMTSCYKEDIIPLPPPVEDIFTISNPSVSNNDDISFNLDAGGVYILKLVDVETSQVLSKEKINLIEGKNNIKIYTKSIPAEYLYLVIADIRGNEIRKTKIKII